MNDFFNQILPQSDAISFDLLRLIINGTTDAIFVKDAQSRYLMINDAGARFLGKTVREIVGKTDYELQPLDVARQTIERDRQVISTGETLSYEVTENVEGVWRSFHTTKSAYRDETGKILGIFGISRDITHRKKVEADRERLIIELQSALNEIKTLKEILPICMHCRKIRDDKGAWTELEAYIEENTNAEFSHGLCKDCYQENYPDLYAKKFPDEKE